MNENLIYLTIGLNVGIFVGVGFLIYKINEFARAVNENFKQNNESFNQHMTESMNKINDRFKKTYAGLNEIKTGIVNEFSKMNQNNGILFNKMSENFDNTFKNLNTLRDDLILNVKTQQESFEKVYNHLNFYDNKTTKEITALKKDIIDNIDRSFDNLNKSISEINNKYEKFKIDTSNKINEGIERLEHTVNTLRLDNLISVTNEINKFRNGIIEDEYFLKEVSHCRVVKFEDKTTGEITEVFYDEKGEKLRFQTIKDGKLKYEMIYKNGVLSRGYEYNDEGNVIFEYVYNEIGEVEKKIEYEYKNGDKIIKAEIKY